jgi:hypothetical protein
MLSLRQHCKNFLNLSSENTDKLFECGKITVGDSTYRLEKSTKTIYVGKTKDIKIEEDPILKMFL